MVVSDVDGGLLDDRVVGADAFQGVAAQGSGKKGLGNGGKFAGDVVLAVELGIVKNRGKDLFGKEVLNKHLAHVGICKVRVDGLLHEF